MAPASDIVFLQDLTGSYSDDLPALKTLLPAVVNRLTSDYVVPILGASKFGLASFKDKPISPFGSTGDYVYRKDVGLTTNAALVKTAVSNYSAGGGGDLPESQLEALMQAALDPTIGYTAGSKRIVFLATDAAYHQAGDGLGAAPGVITIANNGNATIDPNEDYPSIALVKSTLLSKNIVPVFLATSDVKSTYDTLVGSLGTGIVATLGSNSENVADIIKFAIAKANGTITAGGEGTDLDDEISSFANPLLNPAINNVIFSGGGNDSINLSNGTGNNFLDAGAGFDTAYGGIGQDTIDSGSGDDNVYGGSGNDTLLGSSGNDVLFGQAGNDVLQGDSGNDILTGGAGNDKFVFDTGAPFSYTDLGTDTITDFRRIGTGSPNVIIHSPHRWEGNHSD
jgi:serralysin